MSERNAPARIGAIVLAGGRGSRLAGDPSVGCDKAAIELDGVRLVDRVVAAAASRGAAPIVLVGPPGVPDADAVVREDPPFSGPLAALATGLSALDGLAESDWTFLLSCDLVDPGGVCDALLTAREELGEEPGEGSGEPDGLLLVDPEGRRQWLASLHRTAALRRGLGRMTEPLAGLPLRRAFAGSRLVEIPAPAAITADIDTPEDLARARRGDRPSRQEHR